MKSTESDVCYFEVNVVFNAEPVELLEESTWTACMKVRTYADVPAQYLSISARRPEYNYWIQVAAMSPYRWPDRLASKAVEHYERYFTAWQAYSRW